MTKRKRIVALLVGVLLLAGVRQAPWPGFRSRACWSIEFGIGSVAPSVHETLNGQREEGCHGEEHGHRAPAYLRVGGGYLLAGCDERRPPVGGAES